MKVRISTLFLDLALIGIAIFVGADFYFTIGFMLWMNIVIYAIRDAGRRSMLLAFMIAFFTFLMGRDFVQQFFSYQVEDFAPAVNRHLYLCIILSLLAIFGSYYFLERMQRTRSLSADQNQDTAEKTEMVDPALKTVSKYLFYFSWIFAVMSKVIVVRYVSANGYTDYYTDYSEYLTGNTVLYLISKLETIMPVALSIFSASMPSKKEYTLPMLMYVLYMVLSLATGQRSVFILGLLFLMVYFLYRNKTNPEERWITRRMVTLAIFAIPVLAALMSLLSVVRMGGGTHSASFFASVMNFIYDQGVTGKVVKRAYMYENRIPKQIYSLEFLHSGILARLLGIPVYHGNTIKHAQHGGSMSHALGYVILGSSYLAGRGTGSSYIAELYYDMGYLGVVLGNLVYGCIIAAINRPVTKNNVFGMSIRYYIITQILWAPRASLTGFLSNLLAPVTIASFLFVFGFANILKWRNRGV